MEDSAGLQGIKILKNKCAVFWLLFIAVTFTCSGKSRQRNKLSNWMSSIHSLVNSIFIKINLNIELWSNCWNCALCSQFTNISIQKLLSVSRFETHFPTIYYPLMSTFDVFDVTKVFSRLAVCYTEYQCFKSAAVNDNNDKHLLGNMFE